MEFNWRSDEDKRVSLFPIRYHDIWEIKEKLESLHWIAREVDISKDKVDWESMSNEEKYFVKMQLSFFATIDIDVLRNIDENFSREINCLEAEIVYSIQKAQECVHAESYSLQIDCLLDGEDKEKTQNAVLTMPIIGDIRKWVLKWFSKEKHIGERLVAFAAVEGVLFSASFSALQWLRELNRLPGVTAFNSFILRDEGIHTLFTCLLIKKYLINKPSIEKVNNIFTEVVNILDLFITESLPVKLLGMNEGLMKQYVRYQTDCVLKDMNYPTLYKVSNPFMFMDKISLNEVSKTNFFEHRSTEYQNITRSDQYMLDFDDKF